MPTYRVTDSVSGVTLDLTGDSPPTEQELQSIFSSYKRPAEPKIEDQSIFRQVADVPLQFGTGIAQGVRFITDAFGADNAVSQNIRGVEDYLGSLLSAQAKQDKEEVARIFQEAEGQGLGEELLAGLRALAVSPVDFIAQGLGTAVPTIAGGLAGAALRGGTAAARAATAARIGTGVGAVGGAGLTKSTIYDEVKRELSALELPEEVVEERARMAQEYGGENLDQILLGAGLGALAAGTGIEKVLASRILKNAATSPRSIKSAAFAGAKEAAPEFIQAAQEQIAGNVALQREGFEDIPTMRGVASAAALEGSIGFVLGAGIDVTLPAQQRSQYDLARADITNQVDREREAEFRQEEQRKAQEFMAALQAENERRAAGQAQEVDLDAEAANARSNASNIAPPTQEEVDALAAPMRGRRIASEARPERAATQFGIAYGQKIARTLGDYFPNSGQFSVVEGEPVPTAEGQPTTITSPEGARIDLAKPTFVVVDAEGKRYGQPLQTFEQANATAASLNKEIINQNVRGAIRNSLETSDQAYDPETTQRLFTYGYRALSPDANTFSSIAIDEAAKTTGPEYAEALSWRQVESLPEVKDRRGRFVGYELTPQAAQNFGIPFRGNQPRIIKALTKTQQLNKQRSKEGKPESRVFSLEETKAALGKSFPAIVRFAPIRAGETAPIIPIDPKTGKQGAIKEIRSLLRSKNVESKIDSPEINALAKGFTGKSSVNDMDYGDLRLFYKKLADLPRFDRRIRLPEFTFKPYNRENFVRASKFIQQSNAQGIKPSRDQIIEAARLSKEDPQIDEKISALQADLSKQGVKNTPKEPLALPAPPGAAIDMQSLRDALRQNLKGFGLQDIGLTLERNLITPQGQIAAPETEALFYPQMRQIFLAVDRIDPDGSLTPEQRLNALNEVMSHEVIHAARLLDLWKPDEWSNLERAIGKIKKPGSDRTYLDLSQELYPDLDPVSRVEEAVADMFRDYTAKRLKVAGRPQNLLERMAQFFQKLRSALAGTGFQTYQDVFSRLQAGEVGGRQRGEIRTLRATERRAAQEGRLPERLQDVLRGAAAAPAVPIDEPAEEMESRVQTTKAPDWVSQKVWDLHEKSIRADQEESGQVATTFPRRVLSRNATMASRRLMDEVAKYLGFADRRAPEARQQIIDLMVRMNEESSRRETGRDLNITLPSFQESRRAPKKRRESAVKKLFDYSTDDKGRLIVKKNIEKARQLAKRVSKPKVNPEGALVFKAADAEDVINALNNMPTADASIASQVARRLNLSEEEINATSLPLQTGEPTNRAFDTEFIGELPDVVQYLENRRLESGLRPLDIASEEDQDVLAQLIAAETLGAIRSSGNALEWYDETIGKALGIASLKYPELQSDPNAQGIFTIAMAISSQGLNVENNFKFTFKQYDAFRRTGRFPEIGEGEASGAMSNNFKLANDLIDEFGDIGTLRRFLATPFRVEELRRTGFRITDELGDEMVLGSSVFGPKIGFGFYSNLNGNFEPVTMDMWFMRLIGRLTGKLKQFDPELFAEQLVTFRNSFDERGKKGIYADQFDADLVSRARTDDDAALELARRVKKAHEKDFKTNRAEFDSGERSKTQLVNSSDRLINSVDKPKDAPANGTERRNLRSVVRKAVAEVERLQGERIPPAAMQALIWYPEQELYSALGVSLPVTSQDYAGAAQKLLEEEGYDLPTIRAAAESGARRTRQVAGRPVGQRPEEVGAEPQRAIPFEGREREEFIRRRYERTELEKERVAPRRKQVLFEVAPDPNNKPLTEAWRSLDNAVRLAISERIVQDMVPKVLSELDTSGILVNQVGSYLEDTNPSFALLLDKGDVVEVSKALGFALSQDSMMIVSPKEFKGGDLVNSITVELGDVSPQEIESVYNRLREIEVDGGKPVGGQTFTNGGMTILNYSDVDTATLAGLIDNQLGNEYTVYKSKVYSAFPEKKDYDYASERDDGRGQKAVLRKRLRDLRAEATNAVQEQLQAIGVEPEGERRAEPPVAFEARKAPPRARRIAPTQPGPAVDTDRTSAAEALNSGQPVNSIGVPIGETLTDTMPDGTVDISRARIAPLTRRLVSQLIQSAPDKLRSGFGLDDLAMRIENYYDGYDAKLGLVNGFIRDAYQKIGLRGRKSAMETFERYMRARENKKQSEALSILNNASESDRQLIDAWKQISNETGRINQEVRTPDGDPMRVWDSKLNDGKGGWRAIGTVTDFFPRTLRREVMEVMKNPDLDPQLWSSLLDALVASRVRGVETRQDAEKYLIKEWFSDEVKNDYFAGVEKARSEALPEIFYDYSWEAATRYLNKWARRTSQIENFGQELGQFKKEWFGANIPRVRDQETQNYLNSIRERIYEIEPFDALSNMANWLNSLATATQLGNPISASLNLLGGTISNIQEFGIKEVAKSYFELVRDWKKIQEEGTTLGILNKDFMNILRDHTEMDADKYFSKEQRISQALAKFANTALTFGGFNGAENIVRSSAMLAARSRLNSFLKNSNSRPDSNNVKKFRTWANKENIDADLLIFENGSGKETEKYMRRAVNVPQGSYNIDMTPVFIDTTAGRFLFKYQKFGTQINRFFYRHFLQKFMEDPSPANFLRMIGFLGTAIIGGSSILAIREAFGYGDPGPDDEEIKKAFENEDTARAWGLIGSRAWQNIMTAGSLGFFGNYTQFALDWQDQQRVKNPMSPPGLASIDAVIDVFNRLRDQGKITSRDLDEIAETTMSFYRANKRIALAAMDEIGADNKEVERFAAQKELREIREYGRRFSEEMDIEFKRATAPGSPIRTEMTPVNKAITDALHVGDSARAKIIMQEVLKALPPKERQRVRQSIQSSVRNRQPLQVGGNAPSQQERIQFMRWARQNLPADKVEMITQADRNYRRAAARIGMGFGG